MSRPPKHPTEFVVVSLDGRVAAWRHGMFLGDAEIVEAADLAAQTSTVYRLAGCEVTCGSDTALGAAAALVFHSPGRTVITQCPDEVAAWFDEHRHNCSGGTHV